MKSKTFDANRRILVVDDNVSIHEDVRKVLAPRRADLTDLDRNTEFLFGSASHRSWNEDVFEIDAVDQGHEGIAQVARSVAEHRPYALALIDVRMPPGMDGIETTRQIWTLDPSVQVVLCTAYSDYSLAETYRQLGKSDRLQILKKPYEPVELTALATALTRKWSHARRAENTINRQSKAMDDAQRLLDVLHACQDDLKEECRILKRESDRLSRRIQQQTFALVGTREITCFALAQLADSRDPETGEHLQRMRAFSQVIARQLSVEGPYVDDIDGPFLEDLWLSSPLHDIGKVGIPDHVLLKPGKLTPDEFKLIQRHTTIGAQVLEIAAGRNDHGRFLSMAIEIARSHHERVDGGGYPDRLSGDQIPLAARIVAVADVFDALTSQRVYKDAMSPAKAKRIIEADAGTHFDPHVVQAFQERFAELLDIKHRIDSSDQLAGQSIAVAGLEGIAPEIAPGIFCPSLTVDDDAYLAGTTCRA